MAVTDLALLRPDGSLIAGPITLDIAPGEHLLLMGKSGCGKSTLLLTLLGLWPFAKGTITRPKKASLFALSQRPYMPLGTLRDALYYPHHDTLDTSLIEPLLRESNLAHLIPQLDSEEEWKNILSLGEQQRVSMIRAIMHRPDILLMDEPTSSLDEASEATMFALLQRYLPHSTWVTIGHGSTLARYHSRTLQFQDIGA